VRRPCPVAGWRGSLPISWSDWPIYLSSKTTPEMAVHPPSLKGSPDQIGLTKVVKSSPGVMSGRKRWRCIPPPLSKELLPLRWWGLSLVLCCQSGRSPVSAPVTPIICSNMDATLMSRGYSSIICWLVLSLPWGAIHGLWSCPPKPWFNPIHNIYLPLSFCFAWIYIPCKGAFVSKLLHYKKAL
jgi:hypothetical protein